MRPDQWLLKIDGPCLELSRQDERASQVDSDLNEVEIENPETSAAVIKLASALGTTLTEAVHLAVQEKLYRLESKEGRLEEILAIVQDLSVRFPKDMPSNGDQLYGPDGLPK